MTNPFLRFTLFILLASSALAQVNTEKFRTDDGKTGFALRAELNFTIMSGNTDFKFIGSDTRLDYSRSSGFTFLVFNSGFGSNNGKRFFGETLFHLRDVETVHEMIQIETFGQYNQNKERLLIERIIGGAGPRLRLYRTDAFQFILGTSFFYETELYDLSDSAVHPRHEEAVRFNTYLTLHLKIKENAKLMGVVYLQPSLNDWDDIRYISDLALNVNLDTSVDFSTTINMRYDSIPPDDIKKLDMTTKMGISLNF